MAKRKFEAVACEFFREFALFEFAMKRTGFLRSRGGHAEPDWEKFQRDPLISALFEGSDTSQDLKIAISYYKSSPPKKQVVNKQGQLTFVERPVSQTDGEYILDLVKQVRNNLFHGGKFSDGPVGSAPRRDIELMDYGLIILRHCLETMPKMKAACDNAREFFSSA